MRAAGLLLVSYLASFSCLAIGQSARPDVFLITIDTLRADHVHCYGYKQIETPALDSLCADAVRFDHAFTPAPITNSSHATILTGLLPSAHGVTDFGVPLAPDHQTIAELLKADGYHTAAFIGAVILDSNTLAPGLNRGFNFYDNFPEHPTTKTRWGRVERRAMDVSTRAQNWLAAHPKGPHFVWVHLYDPHDPYEPPAPYSDTYKDRLYDGEIAYADSALASFLTFLRRHALYSNAIIVVVGDHGESLGEHGEDTHGIFLYDSTTHVPLIVKLPANGNAAKVVQAQVRTTDILPTVLDLLALRVPNGLNGESLKPYLVAGDKQDRVAFGETDYPLRFGWAPLRSVRTPDYQFIEAPRPELYDLKSDPGEVHNQYTPADETAKRASAMLANLRATGSAQKSSNNTLQQNSPDSSRLPDPKDKIKEANLLHYAMMASEDNRPNDARIALEKVLVTDPQSPTALRQLGELELGSGDYSKAADHLKAARAIRPDDGNAAWLEGQGREKLGDYAGARDALEATLKLNPGQLQARLLLGEVYLKLKDAAAAADQFEAASLIDDNNTAAQLGLARADLAASKPDAALDLATTVSKSDPRNPDALDIMADALHALGKEQESLAARARAQLLRKK